MKGNGKFEALIAKWSMEGVELCPTCRRDMKGTWFVNGNTGAFCTHCRNAEQDQQIKDILSIGREPPEEGE